MSTLRIVPVEAIKVGNRFRKDLGDLDALTQSIKEIGLLHPPVVSEMVDGKHELISGQRRLEAWKKLGRKEVPVHIVNIQNIVDGEIQENAVRKNHTVSEMVGIKRHVESKEKESAQERMRAGKPVSESDRGRVADRIAQLFGISRDTLHKAEEIVGAAEKDPNKYGELMQIVDQRKMSVSRAYKQVMEDAKAQPPKEEQNEKTGPLTTDSDPKEIIDFEFSVPCEEIKKSVETLQMLSGIENQQSVRFDGKINTRTGNVTFAQMRRIGWFLDTDHDTIDPRSEPLFGLSVHDLDEVLLAPVHTVVCGLTRESGKTTALEGYLSRWAEKKVLVFVCKSGEEQFQRYKRITPFIREELATPELDSDKFNRKLQLVQGIQIMDLQNFDSETQARVIGSVAQEIHDAKQGWRDVVLVIPEAWSILPRDRDSPAKLPVESIMRQGAVKGNIVVLDSQDISGIHVPIRKMVGNWIIGKLAEFNELKRALGHLPIPETMLNEMKRSIQTLELGQFYVFTKGKMTKAFAWPVWMSFGDAIDCADDPGIGLSNPENVQGTDDAVNCDTEKLIEAEPHKVQ